MGDDELEAIRRRRMAELQARAAAQQRGTLEQAEAEAVAREEQDAQIEALMRQILTPEARERLARVRLARPEDARSLEAQLVQLAQSGRLQGKITDDQLKAILARLQPAGRDINIRRK